MDANAEMEGNKDLLLEFLLEWTAYTYENLKSFDVRFLDEIRERAERKVKMTQQKQK